MHPSRSSFRESPGSGRDHENGTKTPENKALMRPDKEPLSSIRFGRLMRKDGKRSPSLRSNSSFRRRARIGRGEGGFGRFTSRHVMEQSEILRCGPVHRRRGSRNKSDAHLVIPAGDNPAIDRSESRLSKKPQRNSRQAERTTVSA